MTRIWQCNDCIINGHHRTDPHVHAEMELQMSEQKQQLKFFHRNRLEQQKQFGKKNFPSQTMVSSLPAADEVYDLAAKFMFRGFATHTMDFGHTTVHPKDPYVKKIGREMALKNMKEVDVKVAWVQISPTHVLIGLEEIEGYAVQLRLNKATKKATVLCGHTILDY